MTQLAIINPETSPGYLTTRPNPEPQKVYRYVRLTDESGAEHEGVIETEASLKARLAWSRTAGPEQFRSLDLWLLEQKRRAKCNQCGETATLTTYHREGKYDLELCAECTPGPRCDHCGFELHTSETDGGQVTCCDCRGLVERDRAEAEYWREKCGLREAK